MCSVSPDTAAIFATGLTYRHGPVTAVDRLDLCVPAGRRFGIVGANGAGKTTLMRMLATTLTPDAGCLRVLGQDPARSARAIKRQLGVMPQGMTLDTELAVRENLVTFGRYHRLTRREAGSRADELLEVVGLAGHGNDQVSALSGGMQRRLLIARSLIAEPRLVLMDEPTTGLDPEGRLMIADLVCYGRMRSATVVITSHYLDEVERLCDEVMVLDRGRAVRQGSPRALIDQALPPYVVELAGQQSSSAEGLSVLTGHCRVQRYGSRMLMFTNQPQQTVDLLHAAGYHELLVRPSNLEDALLSLRQPVSMAGTPGSLLDGRPPPVPVGPSLLSGPPVPGEPPVLDDRSPASSEPASDRPTELDRPPAPDGPAGADRPSPIRLLANAALVWERNFRLFCRNYSTTVLPNFFEPIFLLLALGLSLGRYVDRSVVGGSYAQFLAPGLLTVAVANGAIFEVTYNIFVRLRHLRLYDAVITTPLTAGEIATGELLWSLTRSMVYGLVFLGILEVFGLGHSMAALLAPLAFPLIGLPFTCLGMLFTSRARAIGEYSYFYALFLTPLILFSGIFYPANRLGEVGRVLTWCSPLHHGAQLMRTLLEGGSPTSAAGHGMWLLVLTVGLLRPAIGRMRRALTTC